MSVPQLYLVDSDAGLAVALREPCVLAGLALAAVHATPDALLASDAQPDVVVLDSTATGGAPAPAVRAILERWPTVCVVVTGGTPTTISHAVAAGARGFLLKPYAPADLVSVIRESTEGARLLAQRPRAAGHVVAVYSPKGGAGCSTIAVGLSAVSATRPHTRVGLVDLDLQFGDVAVMMDIRSANSIVDLVDHDPLDATVVSETFVQHASGVRVLPAPLDLGVVATIDPARVERTLGALRDHFELVVCDLWSSLDDLSTRVLRLADCVVLVTKPELPALRNVARLLAADDLRLDLGDRVLVVANRVPSRGGLSAPEVEHALGRAVAIHIPSDGAAVLDAINRGIPVVDPRIRTRVHHAYHALTDAVWALVDGSPADRQERVAVMA